jgi:protein SCO1
MAIHETDRGAQRDPIKALLCLSGALSVLMVVCAAVLVWRARDRAAAEQESAAAIAVSPGDDAPSYSFRIKPAEPQPAPVLADFELIERSGRTVTNADLLGQPTVVGFVFINCGGPCPRVTDEMRLLQKRFAGKPVRLVTITVDPERDTPERLAAYADNYGAKQDWLFLTKDQETIYPLIRDSFGLTVKEETGPARRPGWEITHTTRVVHVDASGRIRGKYNALDPAELAQLVRALEKELQELEAEAGGQESKDRDQKSDENT